MKGRAGTDCNGPQRPASQSRCFSVGKRELWTVWGEGGVTGVGFIAVGGMLGSLWEAVVLGATPGDALAIL